MTKEQYQARRKELEAAFELWNDGPPNLSMEEQQAWLEAKTDEQKPNFKTKTVLGMVLEIEAGGYYDAYMHYLDEGEQYSEVKEVRFDIAIHIFILEEAALKEIM